MNGALKAACGHTGGAPVQEVNNDPTDRETHCRPQARSPAPPPFHVLCRLYASGEATQCSKAFDFTRVVSM